MGVFDGVVVIFGVYVDCWFVVGEIVVQLGLFVVVIDFFEIEIFGYGGYGVRLYFMRDLIVVGVYLVMVIQMIVLCCVDFGQLVVVIVGLFQVGEVVNVILEGVKFLGMLCLMMLEVCQQFIDEFEYLVCLVSESYYVQVEFSVYGGMFLIFNIDVEVYFVVEVVWVVLGDEVFVLFGGVNMGGEDFFFYFECMLGCFLCVGVCEVGVEEIGVYIFWFYGVEELFFVGVVVFVEIVRCVQVVGED